MSQPYIGEIRMFAGNFAPSGWNFCDGTQLQISEYDTLFNLIGTTYGGDGQSTFGVPDFRSRVPIHMGTLSGNSYQLGEAAGTEQETLAVQSIPSHSHPLTANTTLGSQVNPASGVLAATGGGIMLYYEGAPDGNMAPAVTSVGGNQPHENTQPFLCINFIISLFGIYPSPT